MNDTGVPITYYLMDCEQLYKVIIVDINVEKAKVLFV